MDYFRILAIAWGIVMLVLLFWNGWVGWNLGRDDKKVQTTEVDVEEIQEKYEYTRQEAYTYTKYYNMLNAQKLRNRHYSNSYSKLWYNYVVTEHPKVSPEKAFKIIEKATKDFEKTYPRY